MNTVNIVELQEQIDALACIVSFFDKDQAERESYVSDTQQIEYLRKVLPKLVRRMDYLISDPKTLQYK